MVDTNIQFLSTHGKVATKLWGEGGNWVFCCTTIFCKIAAIFSIFDNGQHQYFIYVDTQESRDPNFGTWEFCCMTIFYKMTANLLFFYGQHQCLAQFSTLKHDDISMLKIFMVGPLKHSCMMTFLYLKVPNA